MDVFLEQKGKMKSTQYVETFKKRVNISKDSNQFSLI